MRATPKPKLENYESVQHRLQFSGIKKGAKISFHRHFNINTKIAQNDYGKKSMIIALFVQERSGHSTPELSLVLAT